MKRTIACVCQQGEPRVLRNRDKNDNFRAIGLYFQLKAQGVVGFGWQDPVAVTRRKWTTERDLCLVGSITAYVGVLLVENSKVEVVRECKALIRRIVMYKPRVYVVSPKDVVLNGLRGIIALPLYNTLWCVSPGD